MAWYFISHHLLQLVAIYFGIKNLLLGFNRSQSWTFSIRRHTQIGFTFVILTIISYLIGFSLIKL